MKKTLSFICVLLFSLLTFAAGPPATKLLVAEYNDSYSKRYGSGEESEIRTDTVNCKIHILGSVGKANGIFYFSPSSSYSVLLTKNEYHEGSMAWFLRLQNEVGGPLADIAWGAGANDAVAGQFSSAKQFGYLVSRGTNVNSLTLRTSGSFQTMADSGAPVISGLPASAVYQAPITLAPTATDALSGIYSLETYVNNVLTATPTTLSYPGVYSIRVVAYDQVGNSSEATSTIFSEGELPEENVLAYDYYDSYSDWFTSDNLHCTAVLHGKVARNGPVLYVAPDSQYSVFMSKTEHEGSSTVEWYYSLSTNGAVTAIGWDDESTNVFAGSYSGSRSFLYEVQRKGVFVGTDTRSAGTFTTVVDDISPTITSPSSLHTNASSVLIDPSANDAESGLRYLATYLDGEWINTPFSLTAVGSHSVRCLAYDKVGNRTETLSTIVIDRAAPTLSLSLTPSASWATGPVTVSASPSDEAGGSGIDLSTLKSSVDGVEQTGGEITIATEGNHNVSFTVKDRAGNIGTASNVVRIDRTGPAISLAKSPATAWTKGQVTVSASATDGGSGLAGSSFAYSLDSPSGPWTAGSSAAFSLEGTHTVYFRVSDNAGNIGQSSIAFDNVDRSQPTIAIAKNPNTAWSKQSVAVSATALDATPGSGLDPASWYYALDGGTWQSASTALVATAGIHTLQFKVSDAVGNTGTASTTVQIDLSPPLVTISRPPAGSWSKNPILLSASASDPSGGSGLDVSSWSYRINGGTPIAGQSATIAAEGDYLVEFSVRDLAGNTTLSSTLVSEIDLSPPIIALKATPETGWTNQAIALSASVSDAKSGAAPAYSFSLDSATGPWTEASSFSLAAEGSHRVYCRAQDLVGNVGISSIAVSNYDKTPPTISVSALPASPWTKGNYVFSALGSDPLSGLRADGPQYSLNGGPWLSAASGQVEVSNEGAASIRFRAFDQAGNVSEIKSAAGIIDRTAPSLSAPSFRSIVDGRPYPDDGSFIGARTIDVVIGASDSYQNLGVPVPGEVASVSYALSRSPAPDLSNAASAAPGQTIRLSNLDNGLWYVAFRAVDRAGNFSATQEKRLWIDSTKPASPLIESSTHQKATTASIADPSSTAVFKLTARSTSLSGATSIDYLLYDGDLQILKSGQASFQGSSSLSLEFDTLPDSPEGKFYLLSASILSGSGMRSDPSAYPFRVDSSPPQNLRILASPQVAENSWYASKTAALSWERPADTTGVRRYYRLATLTEPELPADPEAALGFDLSAWTASSANSFLLDITSQLSSTTAPSDPARKAGTLWLALCSEDFAGNLSFAKRAIRYDFQAPLIEAVDGSTESLAFSAVEGTLLLRWGETMDRPAEIHSGLSRLALKIGRGELTPVDPSDPLSASTLAVSYDGPSASFSAEELGSIDHWIPPLVPDPETIYVVSASLFDAAGNFSEYLALLKGDGSSAGDVAPSLSSPYSGDLSGFQVSGKLETSGSTRVYKTATALIPAEIDIRRYEGGAFGNGLSALDFQTFSSDEEGLLSIATGGGELYSLSFGPWTFEASAIGIDRSSGLFLLGASWTSSDAVSGSRRIDFPRLNLASPGNLSPTGFSASIDPPLSPMAKAGDGTDFFLVAEGAAQAALQAKLISFAGDQSPGLALDFEDLPLSLHAISGTGSSSSIPLADLRIEGSGELVGALLAFGPSPSFEQGTILEIAGESYLLHAAEIRPDESGSPRLYIFEADLLLPAGALPASARVRDFSVDLRSRAVTAGPDFSISEFTIRYPDGSLFTPELDSGKVLLRADGSLSLRGHLRWGEGGNAFLLSVQDIDLAEGSADWSEARFDPFSLSFKGYSFSIQRASKTTRGLRVEEGSVGLGTLSASVEGLEFAFPLGLPTVELRKEIAQPSSLPLSCAYGLAAIESITVDSEGISTSLRIPVFAEAFGLSSLLFEQSPIDPEGKLGRSRILSADLSLSLAGFEGLGQEISFDGSRIHIGNLKLEALAGFSAPSLDFGGISFSSSGLASEGSSSTKTSYTAGDWSFDCLSLGLGAETGIRMEAVKAEPAPSADFLLRFPSFRAFANGGFDSGSAAAASLSRIAEWDVDVAGSRLEVSAEGEVSLLVPSATIALRPVSGAPNLAFLNLVILPGGGIASGEDNTDQKTIGTAEGYSLTMDSRSLDDSGVSATGSLALASVLATSPPSLPFPADSIRLYPDGTVTASDPEASHRYGYAGWSILGRGWRLRPDGLVVVSSNTVSYRGETLELGELAFFPDGKLAKTGSFELETPNSFINDHFEAYEGILDEDGIAIRALATLPSPFPPIRILFDRVKLLPDGGFIPNASRERVDFALGSMAFHLENVTIDDDGFSAGRASLALVSETGESAALRIYGIEISFEGDFSVGGIDPFEFLGLGFSIDGFSLVDKVFSFSGSLTLPSSMRGELAGKTLDISTFKMNSAGKILEFDARYADELSFPITEGWSISASGVGVAMQGQDFFVVISRGSLNLPPSFGGASATVKNLTVNVKTLAFDFDSIELEGSIPLTAFGIDFLIDELSIASDFEISLGGSATLPADYQVEALRNIVIEIDTFQIRPDGSIGDVVASATLLEDRELFKDLDLLSGASFGFGNAEGTATLSLAGSVRFGSSFPGLAGKVVSIDEALINLTEGRIERFGLSTDRFDYRLFGSVDARNVGIQVAYTGNPADSYFSVSGDIILPTGFSEAFEGQPLSIQLFKVGFDGSLAFSASLAMAAGKEVELFGSIRAKGLLLSANYLGSEFYFGLAGNFVLGESFPSGIRGTSCEIRTLKIDGSGNFIDVDATASLSDQEKLFDTFPVKNASVSLKKSGNTDLLIGVDGAVYLPATFPEGLRGATVAIKDLVISSSGEVANGFSLGASGLQGRIFGMADLEEAHVSLTRVSASDFLCSGGGSLVLSNPSLPTGLRDSRLRASFSVSTERGLLGFLASLETPQEFPLFGGITAGFTQLTIDQDKLDLSAWAKLPANYPNGLANTVVVLSKLRMGWNGSIIDIKGGIGAMNFSLAGFQASISELLIDGTGVSLKSCLITMPSNFGSMANQTIGVSNARFDRATGKFEGAITIPEIRAEISGFELILASPTIDVTNSRVSFVSASLKLPDFMASGLLKLNGVILQGALDGQPAKLILGGGRFSLPDFTIPGGLGFRGVMVDFSINGSKFDIAGAGSAIIPGAGTFSAAVSFTNKSTEYPIGLKRAYFEYEISGPGIPLGTTGLYLNGIRGGIAFGKPTAEEIPNDILRSMFQSGARLQLGLTMRDQSNGYLLEAKTTVWVDVYDWDWAFEGEITLLKGKLDVHGKVAAALSSYGFYAGLDVSLVFVQGHLEIFIFGDAQRRMMFTGRGSISFGLSRGSLYNGRWIKIPSRGVWLGGINAEFGNFKNGSVGFKGFVNFPIVGQVGIFISSGGSLKIGGVSGINLVERPTYAARTIRARSIGPSPSPEVEVLDQRLLNPSSKSYSFTLGEPAETGARLARGASLSEETGSETMPDRVVFVLEYQEGEPSIVAVSPSGRRYSLGDPEVEYEYEENGLIMSVVTTEAGEWGLELGNLPESSPVEIGGFSRNAIPTLSLETPSVSGERSGETYLVKGRTSESSGSVIVYLGRKGDGSDLREYGSAAVMNDGSFEAELELASLGDGEYFVSASLDTDEDHPSSSAMAAGSILLDRNASPLAAPTKLVASDGGEGLLRLTFEDPNGERAKGYFVDIFDSKKATSERLFVGVLRNLELPGYAAGTRLDISVVAVDSANREGLASELVSLTMGAERQNINAPLIASPHFTGKLIIGQSLEGRILGSVNAARITGGAYDSLALSIEKPVDGLSLIFETDVLDLSSGSFEIGFRASALETMAPGSYEIECAARNRGNPELAAVFTVSVELSYPLPLIESIIPNTWNNLEAVDLGIYGSGFMPGTRLLLDGVELPIARKGQIELRAAIPAGAEPGKRVLSVVGPDGRSSSSEVEIIAPGYGLTLHSSYAETTAGEEVGFGFSVLGKDGFVGPALFETSSVPAGWIATVDRAVLPGEEGRLFVTPPFDAPEGEALIEVASADGKRFSVVVKVVAAPVPTIASLSSESLFTGNELSISGYGFGETGSVKLRDLAMEILDYGPTLIRVRVPITAVTGDVIVSSSGGDSNPLRLVIKNRGFSLRPEWERLSLQPGETRTLRLVVSGYAELAALSAQPAEGFSITISPEAVKPNAVATLTIRVLEGAATGNHELVLSGSCADFTTTSSIQAKVGAAFAILTESLPKGMTDTRYLAKLESINADGKTAYTLVAGSLPLGLSLVADGTIGGKPIEKGYSSFSIEGRDEEGHRDRRDYEIGIAENAWALPEMDGGRSGFNPVASPADARRQWSSAPVPGALEIITGDRRIFVRARDGISALDLASGGLLYRIEGRNLGYAYTNETLFVLHEDLEKDLVAYETRSGNERWRRAGVRDFSTDGATILAWGKEGLLALGAADGHLAWTGTAPAEGSLGIAWRAGKAFLARGSILFELGAEGLIPRAEIQGAYTGQPCAILKLAADSEGFALWTETEELVLLGGDFLEQGRTLAYGVKTLGLADEAVILGTESGTKELRRAELEVRYESPLRGSLAAAAEKLALSGEGGLSFINRYDGRTIWSEAGSRLDAALAGEKAYSLLEDGRVAAYNAPDNLFPPETSFILDPALPDGRNGYYLSKPWLSLRASDPETYVAETRLALGEAELAAYPGQQELPEGEYPISAYSTDSKAYREPLKSLNLRIDATAPSSEARDDAQSGLEGWTIAPVTVNLEGSDEGSGLEKIDIVKDGVPGSYSGPLLFNDEGSHSLRWQPIDWAGNLGPEGNLSYKLDLYPPSASLSMRLETGIAVLSLGATDSASGVKRIEYRLDEGSTKIYTEPLVVLSPGSHDIAYRAIDNAGLEAAWAHKSFTVEKFIHGSIVSLLSYSNPAPGRALVENIHEGTRIYGGIGDQDNHFKRLPRYLRFADYLRPAFADRADSGSPYASFYLRKTAAVYLVKHPEALTDMGGWTLVEALRKPGFGRYFPEGSEIYEKTYPAGSLVHIPAMGGTEASYANLVFVKEVEAPSLRIGIDEEDHGDGEDHSPWNEHGSWNSYLRKDGHYRGRLPWQFDDEEDFGRAHEAFEARYRIREKTYSPLSEIDFELDLGGPSRSQEDQAWRQSWRIDWGEGESEISPEDYILPYTEASLEGSVTAILSLPDGYEVARESRSIVVKNRSALELRSPRPDTTLKPYGYLCLSYTAYGMDGRALRDEAVAWLSSRDGETWTPLGQDKHERVRIPSSPGIWYLKAIWDDGSGHSREESFAFTIKK